MNTLEGAPMKMAFDFPFVRARLDNSLARVNNVRIANRTLRLRIGSDIITAMRVEESVRQKLEAGDRRRRRMPK
jgi:hypothetical protein